ncbi:sensor histidine kinase [Azoarcus sp. KH32C]|uniref:sensor histidine kinase n=1 Tax=Azoarcus sp. KH32C TaxID=748247 RepID=UPI0002386AAD|nr:sensor histidine kinase [Azoarcus sp. KH32C]BAL25945.1 two-component system, OmpR family, sensor histidine kinase [Azoarcus sp. KH32C]
MRRLTDRMPRVRSPLGLRRRLILALAIPLLLIVVTSSALDYRVARQTADTAHDEALADTVFDLKSYVTKQQGAGRIDLTQEAEAILRSNAPDLLYFSVRNAAGELLAGDAGLPAFDAPSDANRVQFRDGAYRERPVRIALLRMDGASGPLITVMETTGKRQQSRQRILAAMVLPNLAVVAATLIAVLFGVRHGLLPLQAVEREIAARSVTDLHAFDLAASPIEIRPMLSRLNELFVLLRQASEVQQRFIADAAHQLRTPLAGLQNQLDLAVGEGAFGQNPQRLDHIEEATSRIGHLLSQLLAYARTEASTPAPRVFEAVRLEQLVENSASLFLDAALARDIDLGFEISAAATVGLSWMLQEALSNLIDNAIRYTPRGGVVTVRCGSDGAQPFLEVEDSGPGIAPEHATHVFERFYRIPGSSGTGCGLGLAIVSEIAQVHRAEVLLAAAAPHGLRVRIRFPAALPV